MVVLGQPSHEGIEPYPGDPVRQDDVASLAASIQTLNATCVRLDARLRRLEAAGWFSAGIGLALALAALLGGCTAPPAFPREDVALRAAVALVHPDDPRRRVVCAGVRVPQGVLTAAHCVVDDRMSPQDHARIAGPADVRGDATASAFRVRPVLRVDLSQDLALLGGVPGPVARVGATPRLGDPLYSVGHPLGLPFVVHSGRLIVSRPIPRLFMRPDGARRTLVRMVADLNAGPGSSGGPVFDAQHELVGIVTGTPAYGLGQAYASATLFAPTPAIRRFLAGHP